MEYENSNVIKGLRNKLIDYIVTLDEKAKDLDNLDYYQVLDMYKKLLGDYNGMFNIIVADQINDYHLNYPEETLSDMEIIEAMDIYNPINYFSLLTSKIDYYKKKLSEYQKYGVDAINKGKNVSEDPLVSSIFNDAAKNIVIYTRGIEKCERIIHIIEDEYIKTHTR